MHSSRLKTILLIYGLLELACFIALATWLGFALTFFILLALSAYGSYRLKAHGLSMQAMQSGSPIQSARPVAPIKILCDFLFMLPGFITAALGILLLIPFVRRSLQAALLAWLRRQGVVFPDMSQFRAAHGSSAANDDGPEVITKDPAHSVDGASAETKKSSKKPSGNVIEGEFKRRD